MEEPLIRVLGLIAGGLEPAARSRFLPLVPPALRPGVERLTSPEAGRLELTPAEAELLAPLKEAETETGSAPDDAEETPVQPEESSTVQSEEEESVESGRDPLAGQMLSPGSAWLPETGEPALPVLLALLASAAPEERAAALLSHLPLDLQAEVVRRLAVAAGPGPDRGLSGDAATWATALTAALSNPPEPNAGLACRVLRALPSGRALRDLLNALDGLDHEVLLHLQLHLFVFADLVLLPDREVQVLLSRVDNHTLARALQLCPEALRRRLLANVSDRRRALLAEEEEQEAYTAPNEVEAAHLRLIAIAQDLYEQGRISTYLGSIGPGEPAPPRPSVVPEESEEPVATTAIDRRRRWSPAIVLGLVTACSVVALWILSQVSWPKPEPSTRGRPSPGLASDLRFTVMRDGAVVSNEEMVDSSGAWATPSGIRAVLELPLKARLEMEEETRVEQPVEGDTVESGGVYLLRIGTIRTTVLDRPFEVRTPAVKVIGQPGAVFTTRVTLDATTVVQVAAGTVEVASIVEPADHWSLEGGVEGRFGPRGGGTIR